jgi:two-component system response regulator HydG
MIEKPKILIVDDDISNLASMKKLLEKEGYWVRTAERGEEALDLVRTETFHVIITDLKMPGMDGIDLLKSAKTVSPNVDVVIMSAYGTIEIAVEAMKEQAYDFITKPFRSIPLLRTLNRILERQNLLDENLQLKQQLKNVMHERILIGDSPSIRRVMELVKQVGPTSATVLVTGESGTGKELVARTIHLLSDRNEGKFVAINCAAIPETILESELFGYEKGAFTGAVNRKQGRFELADRGTLFLDEIGEMHPHLQVKLLRVIQEGEFERLGGTQSIKTDVRIVASTNKNLPEEVKAGRFREDLFYRLNVISIRLPALRERTGDIPLLAHHFLNIYTEKNKKRVSGFSPDVMDMFIDYNWPGNVRELMNAVERAVVLCRKEIIQLEDLPEDLIASPHIVKNLTIQLGTPLDEIEQTVIQETLKMTKGNKRLAAQLLGIATRTIYRKMETTE